MDARTALENRENSAVHDMSNSPGCILCGSLMEPLTGELAYPLIDGLDTARLADFVARSHAVEPSGIDLHTQPMRGGLEATGVARVVARFAVGNKRRTATFVVKRLDGPARREADLYRDFLTSASTMAPRLLDIDRVGPETNYLYLEYIRRARAWPWRELSSATKVLNLLADLHARVPTATTRVTLATWDYEAELGRSSLWTLGMFDQAVIGAADLGDLRRYGPALRRLVLGLPQMRAELLGATPSGSTILHGDVHSRNVILRAGSEQPVLIDWGRARLGSELEDVSSWLHSLGTWEPEIRRRHDTLLRRYLAARGLPTALLRTVRDAYWLALASNSLSGALGYQLAVSLDTFGRSPAERLTAIAALRQHLRVIRRADSVWRA
jgi:hypothetical protein